MKYSKLIALSAISAALSTVFLIIGVYVPVLDYSGIMMASVCMLLPLTQKSIKAGLLTYTATCLLSLIFIGGRFEITICFAAFFGLHPVFNYFQREKKIKYPIALVIKEIWFLGVVALIYVFFESFIGFEAEWARKYAWPILMFGGALFLVVYDFMMMRFQTIVDSLIKRLRL